MEVITCRVADQNNLHQAALKVVIKPLTEDCQVDVKTGIDGQQTNFGTQQLVEKELRVFGDDLISASYQTTESKIDIGIAAKFNKAGVFQAKIAGSPLPFQKRSEKIRPLRWRRSSCSLPLFSKQTRLRKVLPKPRKALVIQKF